MNDINPKRSVIYYGWWIVTASFLISVYTAGVVYFGFTAVFEPIAQEFNWSYTQISLAASLRGLETGLLAPLVGFLTDRWGPRRLVFGGAVSTGAGLVLLSRIDSLATFYLSFILLAIGVSTSIGTILHTAVVNWFKKYLPIATGIMACGVAIGGFLVVPVTLLIDTFGWRSAMAVLGAGTWIIGIPLSLLIRHKPEQYGYYLDGITPDEQKAEIVRNSIKNIEQDVDTRHAISSREFWHISLALMYQSLVLSAVVIHIMPYLSTMGISRSLSSFIASAMPISNICGRLGFGWLGTRLDKKKLTIYSIAFTGAGVIFFGSINFGGMYMLIPFLLFFGVGWGSSVVMRILLLREYFGRSHFGAIHGLTVGIMTLGNLFGPPLVGWVFDTQGSYQYTWPILGVLSIVPVIVMATLPTRGKSARVAKYR